MPLHEDTRDKRALARLAYVLRACKAFARDPYEAYERCLEKLSGTRDRRELRGRYEVHDWSEQGFHELVGAGWPCHEEAVFGEVWTSTMHDVAASGLRVGRGAFGGWDDGDARLVQLAWCMARHSRPAKVVETGVARGITTRALLEALGLNHEGHLWSIDLPPLLESDLAAETAIAVPARLHKRWTFVRGSSRRVLPGLVAGLGRIDLFIHDSMHTSRNVRFELECVWPALSPGGAVLVDDVERNTAVGQFLSAHPGIPSMIWASEDGKALIACIVKPRSHPASRTIRSQRAAAADQPWPADQAP